MRAFILGLSLCLPVATWAPRAFACSGGAAAPTGAFPSSGALGVSPQSSLFIVSGSAPPAGLTLRANGTAVSPAPALTTLGPGVTPAGLGTFYRMAGPLQPSSDYALEVSGVGGAPVELTHFSTAATYDKAMGVAPTIDGLRLWRVHYPPERVRAGGCVFSEYEGYFALDFTPASVPGTPDAEVVSVLTLSSDQLGTTQTFAFQGVTALPGGFVPALTGDGVTLPEGGALSASAALWKPNLEPGRTFCATITSYGRNDLAAPLLQSRPVCVTVVGIETSSGAGGAPGAGGAGGSPAAGGAGGSPAAGGAGGSPATGASGGSSYPIGNDAQSPGACSLASGRPGGAAGGLLAAVIAAALLWRRRARRPGSQL